MSFLYHFNEDFMMVATYPMPAMHSHLASHIIISLGNEMEFQIEEEKMACRGICIGPNIRHTGTIPEEGALIFLFTQTSTYMPSIKRQYLKDTSYYILEENKVEQAAVRYKQGQTGKEPSITSILLSLAINEREKGSLDPRVETIISYIANQPSIGPDIYERVSRLTYLSKSRVSHIFRQETDMTLHSYLALKKLQKTYKYVEQGMTITEACVMAGFDTPSHCAATCKRMFGISLREILKSIKDSV